MTIKQSVINQIAANDKVIMLIAIACRTKARNVENWISKNDLRLTSAAALEVIRKELNLSDKQIFNS